MVLKRVTNYLWHFINLLKLKVNHVSFGNHVIIHGNLGITVHPGGGIFIGDNCYISSGNHMNPLCGNVQGHLCVFENATIMIGNNVAMSSPHIWAHKSITIGNNVLLGGNVTVLDSDCHSMDFMIRRNPKLDHKSPKSSAIIIEDDVFIGMNSMILKGVTIGARSIVGAGSVVTKSVPCDSIVCGNPARVIKRIENR